MAAHDKIKSEDLLGLIQHIEAKGFEDSGIESHAVDGYYLAYASLRIAEALERLVVLAHPRQPDA